MWEPSWWRRLRCWRIIHAALGAFAGQGQLPHRSEVPAALAARLGIHLLLLPKQRSELNCIDHLWRALKQLVSANRQYPSVQQHVDAAIRWVLGLRAEDALRKAGCLAEGFWLRNLLENFWRPT